MEVEDRAADAERDHQVFLYILAARGFADAATAAYDHRYRVGTPWSAIIVNLSFAIELALKAYIYSKNSDDEELRGIGHNLGRALSVACAIGFVSVHGLEASVKELQKQHHDLTVRYLSVSYFVGGNLETHLETVHRLIGSVHKQVGIEDQSRWSRQAWPRPCLLPDVEDA